MKDFFNARQRFSIRKFSFGAASVLLGTVFLAQAPVAHADATTETEASTTTTATSEEDSATSASSTTASTDTDTTQATGTLEVKDVAPSATTAAETSETPAAEAAETTTTPADTSKLASQIAALEAAISKAPAGTDAAALTQAKVVLAQAKSIQASTSASQAEVDAQAASLADMVTVVTEAASQANQAETESKEVAAEAAQPAEKTELEKTVSEAQVTNKLATDFVETEAPAKEVAVDLTNAVKSAVADNQAQITAAQTVLADGNATTAAYQTAMGQLKSSIEAVYVSLRKAGKEDFAVALADTAGEDRDATNNGTHIVTTEDNVPVDQETKDAIDKLKLGEGVGVLVDKTQTVTPDMQDPNGAKLKDPKSSMPNTTPTENADYHTFGYFGLHWLDFAGVDKQLPKDYYMRASSNKDDSKTEILLEMVKFSDQSVVESHTIDQKQQTDFTSLESVATGSLSKAYPIKALYDTTARDESKNIGGQVILYFAQIAGGWSMGSYNIPLNSAYVTKYVTDDGKLLATYSLKGSSKQMSTPSDVREFSGYTFKETQVSGSPKLNVYNIDAPALDANNYQYKRLLEMVKADGTAVKSLWIVDPTLSAEEKAKVNFSDENTDGFIKVLETSPMEPGGVNENIKVITGQKLSDGTTLISEEAAAEIEAKAADNDGVDFGTNNTVKIWQDPNNDKNYIRLGFVGNYGNVRPYGVTTPGKSAYMQTTFAPQTNYKLVPLENDALYVPTILHVYTKAGDVLVKYVDQDGNEVSGTGLTSVDATTGTTIPAGGQTAVEKTALTDTPLTYDTATETLKPQVIKTADGSIYYLVGLEQDKSSYDNNTPNDATDNVAADETGTVQQGTTTITYQYAKAGSVSINYIATDGTVIKQAVTDVENGKPGDAYNAAETTTDNTGEKPARITTADGKVYKLVTTAGTTTGGTTQLTYDANGVVTATADGGNTINNNPIGGQTGEVAAGKTTEVTYVYQEVKGDVTVKYIDDQGNELAGTATMPNSTEETVTTDGVKVADQESLNENYDTTSKKATRIVTADGKVYELAGNVNNDKVVAKDSVKDGSADEKGQVAEDPQNVTYVYKEVKGDVVVKYKTTDGTQLSGNLKLDGSTTATTVDAKGVKVAVDGETEVSGGTDYNTANYKPTTIETADGKKYELVKVAGTATDGTTYDADAVATGEGNASATGKVVAGKTQTVTYIYQEVKGSVVVKYETTDGTPLKGNLVFNDDRDETTVPETGREVEDATDVSGGTKYETTDYKPTTITTADRKVYRVVPQNNGLKDGSAPESGDTATVIAGETRTVTYLYEEVKGDVTVKYIDDQGNELAGTATMPNGTEETVTTDGVKVANQESLNENYDTTSKKATRIVTADGKVYELAGNVNNDKVVAKDSVKDGSADEKGQVAEDPQNVTYVYKEVKGSVKVNYVDAEGNPISGATTGISKTSVASTEADVDKDGKELTDVSAGTAYDTTDVRPATITTADGTVYYYKEVHAGSAAETGKVEAGKTTEVTYAYEKAGSVVVKYVTTDGTKLEGDLNFDGSTTKTTVPETGLADETNAEPGKEYNTTDHKPETITTADGKTYALVAENNGVKSESAPETGEVKAGETTTVTYVYQEVKGNVVVEYYDEAGEKIAADKTVKPETSTGVDYDATTPEYRPATITTANGDVYYYKEVKSDSEPTSGKVTEGETVVKYVYAKAGSVTINYIATDGTVLQTPVKDMENAKPGTAYDTTENSDSKEERPTVISTGGKVYRLVQTAGTTTTGVSYDENGVATGEGHYPTTGTVKAGLDKNVTYVYQEVKFGDVDVAYINTKGEKIAETENVVSGYEVGSDYTTTPKATITVKNADGTTTTYRLVKQAGTTENGVSYDANGVATGEGNAPQAGKVTDTTQTVTYVYEAVKGSVVVNYIDENGDPISGTTTGITKTSVSTTEAATTGANVGTAYNTRDLRPETITTAEGKVYKLLPALTKGNETGQVTEGTTEVTYVYQLQTGDVDVHYVNTDGKEIAPTVKDTDDADTGSNYDTTDHKPEKIVEDSTGDVYYYKEIKSGNSETGKVTAGTTDVTYVYEKAGNVVVNYVATDGTVLKDQVKDETNAKPGSGYDTIDNKPATITKDGKNYQLVAKNNGLQDGSAPETGDVEAGKTTEITYVYEEVKAPEVKRGNVVVENYDTKGNKLGETTEVVKPSPEGTDYTTTPADKIESNGKTYYYKEVKSDSEATSGKVKEGTTTVKYVYEEAGNVVVNYVTTDGTVIKDQVKDETNAKPGSAYDTIDNKPATITKDGKTYQLVAKNNGLQDGSAPETGDVEAGTTVITYVYREVVAPTPTEDKATKFVEEGTNTVLSPDEKGNQPKKDITGYEFVKTITDESGNTVHIYRKVVTPTPTEDKVTKFVEEGTNTVLSPDEKGNQPKKDITGYEFVRTETDANGNTVHIYRKVVTPTPTEDKVTKFVEEGINTVLSPDEKGNQPKKDITGYEFVRTETDANGNTVHIYRKVVTPTPTEDKVTKFVEEGTNTVLSPEEKGNQPKKDITGYEFVRTETDANGNTVHIYRKVVTPTPTEDKVTKFVEEGTNTVLSPDEKGNQPKKDITGYEFVKTITDESGNTVHIYRKVVAPTPTEDKVTKFVEEGSNTVLSPDEKGNQPKKDITGYEFVKTITDESGNTIHIYRKVVTPTPTEGKVTKFVEEGTNTVLSPDEKGNQPKKDITGYEFVRTETDANGNTVHIYRKVVTPTRTEDKVTKFVEEGTNAVLSPDEKGNQPKKDITGYEFVKTITDESGNTVHVYRKVVTPTPQPTPNPQPTPQPEPTPVPQPEPQPKPTPTNVTPAHDAPVQPAAVVTPAQTSAPASATEKQLPNTGTENHAGLAALGLAGLLGGFGLISRKKKED